MTPEQYLLARRLAEAHPDTCSRPGLVLERHRPGKRPLRRRVVDARDALDDLADGYAPDLSDPGCVGVLLEPAARLVPGVSLTHCRPQWRAEAEDSDGPCGWGDTPGEALARLILEVTA